MWHLYNIIASGDTLKSSTVRGVTKTSATGSVNKSKIRITISILVDNIEFDAGNIVFNA